MASLGFRSSTNDECLVLTFGPQGKTILTAFMQDRGASHVFGAVLEADTAKPAEPLLQVPRGQWIAFSSDGRTAVTVAAKWDLETYPDPKGGDEQRWTVKESTVQLWETDTWKPIGPPHQHQGRIWQAALSHDAQSVLLVQGKDWGPDANTGQLYDTATWQSLGPPWPLEDSPVTTTVRGMNIGEGLSARLGSRVQRGRRP